MMTNVTNKEIDAAIKRMMLCANDPMWADHAEVPKIWCKQIADLLRALRKERNGPGGQGMSQMQG